MYRLKLFGGATLEDPEGPLSGRVTQRRQLALLAFLSLQGDRPTPRDKLLALLWPESNTERARHNLADSVYLVRKALGEESVRSHGDDLVLLPDHVLSDVTEFESLVEKGELETAANLYGGPFLDAFHLPDSREFEHWLQGERERLERVYLGAVEELASAAGATGNQAEAVEWWHRAAAIRPHNSRVAVGLMASLAVAGDRPGALRWAAVHGELLREEFGIDPDPSVTALARKLREGEEEVVAPAPRIPESTDGMGDPRGPDPFRRPAASGHPAPKQGPPRPVKTGGEGPDPGLEPPPSHSHSERRRPGALIGFALGLGILFLAAALYLRNNGHAPPTSYLAHGLDADAVVVVPFRTAGASPEVEYLGQGMVELLAAKFGAEGVLRAGDPANVLVAWHDLAVDGLGEPSLADAVELARAVGAGNLVTGAVVGTRSALTIHGALVDVATQQTVARATAEGTENELQEMVDRTVALLLALRAGEEEHRLAQLTSASLPALLAFLEARAAQRKGDYEEALRNYGRALDLDSTFALAGVGVTQLTGWVGGAGPLESRGRAVALRYLDRLSARDRAGLMSWVGIHPSGSTPSAMERIRGMEELLRRWPDHPVLWHQLGCEIMRMGQALGLRSWERRARESLQRAVELDPDYAEPVHHLAVLLAETGNPEALAVLVEEQLARHPAGPVADYLRWRAHRTLGDDSPVRSPPLEAMDPDATLRWIAMDAQDYGVAVEGGARAAKLRLERPGIPDQHLERRRGAFAYALNGGRPAEALSILESIQEAHPDPHAFPRKAILTALYADGDEDAAAEAARELTNAPTDGFPGELNLCVLAQWRLAREAEARSHPHRVRLPPLVAAADTSLAASYRAVCSAVVHAQHDALATGRTDGPATEHLESLMAMGRHFGLVDDGHTEFAHVALARLHEAAGHPEAALRALRRRSLYMGWQPYLATMLREEGRLAVSLGHPAGALRAWEHYLAFRTDPEPPLRDEVERIRREVEGLRKDGDGPQGQTGPFRLLLERPGRADPPQ